MSWRSAAFRFTVWYAISLLYKIAASSSLTTTVIAGRSNWDFTVDVGLLGSHSSLWKGFDHFGKIISSSLAEFAATLTQTTTDTITLTLLNGEWFVLRQLQIDHLDTSVRFSIDHSSQGALRGGIDVARGTEFALHLAPFAGYEEKFCMLQIALRVETPSQVAATEATHNTNYLVHMMNAMADAIRIAIGAFPCSAEFRSISGTCNNPKFPDWGSVGTYLRRLPRSSGSAASAIDPSYALGTTSEPEKGRPNARDISNVIFGGSTSRLSARRVSAEIVWWGQWIDHDSKCTSSVL